MSDGENKQASQAQLDAERKAAQIAKLQAETAKLQADAAAAEATAKVQQLRAEGTAIEHERFLLQRRIELSSYFHHRVHVFNEQVSHESVDNCMGTLLFWHHEDPTAPMEIIFDSPGGDVFAGLALYDFIQEMRAEGHHITTSARGMAASMAGILLQAGDTRTMGAESWMLIHEIQAGALGKMGVIEDRISLLKRTQDRILDIFASRSKLSKKELERGWQRKDWWLSSKECLEKGLVDELRYVTRSGKVERKQRPDAA